MRRSPVLATAILSLAFAACKSDPSLITHGCLVTTDRATCAEAASASAPLQSKGTVDAAYAGEYSCSALVEGAGLSGPVTLTQADVAILDPSQGDAALAQFTVPVGGTVDPSTPFVAAQVELIDAATLAAEAQRVGATGRVQEVVVRYIMVGRTSGGDTVTAPSIDYPVDVSFFNSCAMTGGQPCIGSAVPDCRLGLDELAGTSCQAIAAQLGICNRLECTTKGDATTAHCPTHIPADSSCCP